MAWKIKSKPEDFVVREMIHDETEESWKEKMRRIRGLAPEKKEERYAWLTMKKEDADFFRAIEEIAKRLSISTRDIGYAGTKDRRAVTYQTISVPADKAGDAVSLKIPGVSFSGLRYRNRPIKLGEHEGNSFEIAVRGITRKERAAVENGLSAIKARGFVNLFGGQRFGSASGSNDSVGRKLVHGDIEGAAKELIASGGSCRDCVEARMKAHLKRRPGDYMGALRIAPLRMLKLFVHAYQSRIWNGVAQEYAKSSRENTLIPVVGYMTDVRTHPKVRGLLQDALDREKIGPEDFRNAAFKELSSRGTERDFIVVPGNMEWEWSDEKNEAVLMLRFSLPKGSYATELVRQLEKPEN